LGSPGSELRLSQDKFESRLTARVAKEDVVQVMQEGQTIKHEVYGLGIVTASDQERTAVDFDDHGAKLFVTSIMTAELIGEAPATPRRPSGGAKRPLQPSRQESCGRSRRRVGRRSKSRNF